MADAVGVGAASGDGPVGLGARSGPIVTRFPNWGLASTPLSTTATLTPAPRVSGHTLAKPSACWAQGVAAGAATALVPGQPADGWGNSDGDRLSAAEAGVASAAVRPSTAASTPPARSIVPWVTAGTSAVGSPT